MRTLWKYKCDIDIPQEINKSPLLDSFRESCPETNFTELKNVYKIEIS